MSGSGVISPIVDYFRRLRQYDLVNWERTSDDDDHEAKLPMGGYRDGTVEEEEPGQATQYQSWRSEGRRHFAAVVPFLLKLILSILLLGLVLSIYVSLRPSKSSIPNQPMTVVPTVPNVVHSFAKDLNFLKAPNKHNAEELNATWDALLPPGRGFVLIEDNLKYKLHTGLPTGDGDARFSISMFHQLHCLDYVRRRLYQIILKLQEGRASEIDLSYEDQVEHLPHCLDYIRQGIMCCGDTSLEGAIKSDLGTVIFGVGSDHVCKDFQAIYDFTAEHADYDF